MSANEIIEELEELRSSIRRHDRLYYVEASPEISDYEYDELMNRLKRLESDHPELVTSDSPTQRVGGEPLKRFDSYRHAIPMMSLDNTYNYEEVARFVDSVEKGLHGEPVTYFVEPKIDGVSISIRYEHGVLTRALTRGNGTEGDDVTANIRTIESVPLRLTGKIEDLPAVFEARGEVYMSRSGFSKMNALRIAHGEDEFANSRNATAGSLKSLDPRIVAERPLDVLFYTQGEIDGIELNSQQELFDAFMRLGLRIQRWCRHARNLQEILSAIDELREARHDFPYDTDGAVIKVNSFEQRSRLGSTAKSPSWAKAYKFAPEQAETLLKGITIQVGRTGVLAPVAELAPVFLAGSTISRATLHNEDEIARKDIRIGDTVTIEKAGEVIPKVVGVVMSRRPQGAVSFDFPGHIGHRCPACGGEIERDPNFTVWRCLNLQCPAQSTRRLEYFGARNALDLECMGGVVADALVDSGLVEEPLDLFELSKEQLMNLNIGTQEEPRIFKANGEKLYNAIQGARSKPLSNWIFALGIPEVGKATAYVLGRCHRNLKELSTSRLLKGLLKITGTPLPSALTAMSWGKGKDVSGNSSFELPEKRPDMSLGSQETGCMTTQKVMSETVKKSSGEMKGQLSFDFWLEAKEDHPDNKAEMATKPQKEAASGSMAEMVESPATAEELISLGLLKGQAKNGKFATTSVGPKAAFTILEYFAGPQGRKLMQRLEKLGIDPQGMETDGPQPLAGKTFVLTGTLMTMGRDEAEAMIRALGGSASSSVSRKTSFLVAGANTGATKTEAAAKYGVPVIDETEFLKLINVAQEP